VEQLTFLLFLKMADEQAKPPFNKPSPIPKGNDWPALLAKAGDDLEIHYRHTLLTPDWWRPNNPFGNISPKSS
jgi:type I restriction enzyme M protein